MLEAGLVEPPFKPDVSTRGVQILRRATYLEVKSRVTVRTFAPCTVIFTCEAQACVLQRRAGHR